MPSLQAYLSKAPGEITSGGHLVAVLGVFQKLIASKVGGVVCARAPKAHCIKGGRVFCVHAPKAHCIKVGRVVCARRHWVLCVGCIMRLMTAVRLVRPTLV